MNKMVKLRFHKIMGTSFKKIPSTSGFSLVEMIVYVAIFSIMFTVILNLFWRVQLSGSRVLIANEVTENTSQVMQIISSAVRQGDSIDKLNSVFGSHPGVLLINDDELLTIDTYTKNVNIGGSLVSIRTLRLTRGLNEPIDLTSDHVNVHNFWLTDISQPGHPDVLRMDLGLSNINPGGDPDFDNSLSVRTSITIRKEL